MKGLSTYIVKGMSETLLVVEWCTIDLIGRGDVHCVGSTHGSTCDTDSVIAGCTVLSTGVSKTEYLGI